MTADHIAALIAEAPPLSAEQLAELRRIVLDASPPYATMTA